MGSCFIPEHLVLVAAPLLAAVSAGWGPWMGPEGLRGPGRRTGLPWLWAVFGTSSGKLLSGLEHFESLIVGFGQHL